MLWTIGTTALCAASIGFYLRFAVALCRECSLRRNGYWMLVRVQSQPDTTPTAIFDTHSSTVSRAA